VSYGGAVTL